MHFLIRKNPVRVDFHFNVNSAQNKLNNFWKISTSYSTPAAAESVCDRKSSRGTSFTVRYLLGLSRVFHRIFTFSIHSSSSHLALLHSLAHWHGANVSDEWICHSSRVFNVFRHFVGYFAIVSLPKNLHGSEIIMQVRCLGDDNEFGSTGGDCGEEVDAPDLEVVFPSFRLFIGDGCWSSGFKSSQQRYSQASA